MNNLRWISGPNSDGLQFILPPAAATTQTVLLQALITRNDLPLNKKRYKPIKHVFMPFYNFKIKEAKVKNANLRKKKAFFNAEPQRLRK